MPRPGVREMGGRDGGQNDGVDSIPNRLAALRLFMCVCGESQVFFFTPEYWVSLRVFRLAFFLGFSEGIVIVLYRIVPYCTCAGVC